MSQERDIYFRTANMLINSNTGEVSSKKQKLRLSPVNSRVLNVLLQEAKKAVSRQQLFDGVWPNQVVSDDALTRSISDLRSQLKSVTTTEPLIETIPKVGYRWLPVVELNTESPNTSEPVKTTLWLKHFKPMLMALAVLTILLWGLLGVLYLGSKSTSMPLIILPTEHIQPPNSASPKADVSAWLKQAVMEQDNMQYLSGYALQSHAGSPFPYYSHEFGVRWFIESQISQKTDQRSLTLNLIDAKTALVIYSQQHSFKQVDELKAHCNEFVAFVSQL
ncbi:hypothetical protein MNBD_GAMMA01-45 [hydrothermal vent metagenome]|uniref:OmpR/PhoB-type domain-containing protein n=1 Tax=hydrothermal vent metagenome TaxID=652676 RepID=A0A3B0UV04_9ZZZZ